METGELIGLEVWEASQRLSPEVIESLPRLGRGSVAITREDLAESQPA